MGIYLNIGAGPRPIHPQHLAVMEKEAPLSEWTLADKYIKEPGTTAMDASSLPYKDGEVDVIYSSHLLEHMSLKEVFLVLREWYRTLKPEGKIIINVPDLEWAAQALLGMMPRKHPTLEYKKSELFNTPERIMEVLYGNQDHEGEFHKSGFTAVSLEKLLENVGFRVEHIIREFEAHEMGCLIATAVK